MHVWLQVQQLMWHDWILPSILATISSPGTVEHMMPHLRSNVIITASGRDAVFSTILEDVYGADAVL